MVKKHHLSLVRHLKQVLPYTPSLAYKKIERCLKLACLNETFTPFEIISTLNTGYWYSFEKLAAFTDVSGTIQANVNDGIACLKCWTDTGRNITQSTSTARPTLLSDGASFNATNRTFLISDFNLSSTSFTLFCITSLTTNNKGAFFANLNNSSYTAGWGIGQGANSTSSALDADGNNLGAVFAGTGFLPSSSSVVGPKRLLGITRFPNTTRLWNNNVITHVTQSTSISTGTPTGGFQVGGYYTIVGDRNRHFTGTLHATIGFNSFLSESQRRQVAKFFNFYYELGVSF